MTDERKWCTSHTRRKGKEVYRKSVDTPTHDYQRVGLYLVTKKHKKRNFCDVHVNWSYPTADLRFRKAYYSGPKQSINDITTLSRSDKDIDDFVTNGKAGNSLNLKNGGRAYLELVRGEKATFCWFFGPLRFNGVSYGTLVAKLNGAPKKSYQSCQLYSSSYAEGHEYFTRKRQSVTDQEKAQGWTVEDEQELWNDTIRSARKVKSVPLPRGVTRIVWRLESSVGNVRICDLYNKKG